MTIRGFMKKLRAAPDRALEMLYGNDDEMLALGKMLSELMSSKKDIKSLFDVEYKIFSQFGDDGIIQWLIRNIELKEKTFIEFGVQDYRESNTRFLLMNDNWIGFVMDGSIKNINKIRRSSYYWKHSLRAEHIFINTENVNQALLIPKLGRNIGILHIDIDGMDYWIWEKIESINPHIVILEYNSVFGIDRAITVPYSAGFIRTKHHHSNLYFGASLRALYELSSHKGYAFLGCNSAGNNAYFVLREHIHRHVKEVSLEDGYVESKFRESRDHDGMLNFAQGEDRLKIIKGLPVINTKNGALEYI